MTSTDDIWASMNESSTSVVKKKSTTANKSTSKKVQKDASQLLSNTKSTLSYDDMRVKLSRDVNASGEESANVRKSALVRIRKILFEDHDMSAEDYGKTFRDVCKNIFKRFTDPVEKCRELAQRITQDFFAVCCDFSSILGYYFPALMQRLPAGLAYDDEMKVFVVDMEAHEAYRRGKATERQDKVDIAAGSVTHQVVESAEEIRLITCSAIYTLVKRVKDLGSCTVLHAYFQDIVMFVQAQLRDPYPDLKAVACNTLELLAGIEDFEIGMKLYAVGLVRGILPVLRHRHAKVRIAALTALRFVMTVPNRAKRKASGSDAICDMVGFREENVLQIAAFYRADVQLNYLAELVNDKSVHVKERLVEFLTDLLTVIDDRYDHQTRLLPYLLDLLTDDAPTVSSGALSCLVTCGRQYEEEHFDEIVERRQYGVDGDDRINLDKPFPAPFKERPRLGIRLYARGNTKRFLTALVGELTNWVSTTRMKSAQLLKMVIVLCEEHLTMEIHTLLPSFIKALRFAHDDKDAELHALLLEVFELLGRYIAPEVYVYYLLPRLRGDVDVVQFGVDAETRITVMEFLQALLDGTKPSLLPPHFEEIVTVLTDPYVVSPESVKLQLSAMDVLITALRAMKGKSNAVIEAHFVSTGRLTNLRNTVRLAFRFLLLNISRPELHDKAHIALTSLCELEFDGIATSSGETNNCGDGVLQLFAQHGVALFKSLAGKYELDSAWSVDYPEHVLLSRLVECPSYVLQGDSSAFQSLLQLLCTQIRESGTVNASQEVEESILCSLSDLLISAIQPVFQQSFETNNVSIYRARGSLTGSSSQMGMAGLYPNTDRVAQSSAVVAAQLEGLVRAFVLDMRWNRSPRLQLQRLRVLSALVAPHEESDSPCGAAALSGATLVTQCASIFDTLLVSASVPSNPVSLRICALATTEQILSAVSRHAGYSKLKSFQHWRASHSAADSAPGAGYSSSDLSLQCKVAVHRAVANVVSMLDDGNDDVRVRALQTLSVGAPLILADGEISHAGRYPSTPATTALISYSEVVRKLLTQLTISNCGGAEGGDPFVDQLDSTLRALAVLEPTIFEQLVRVELAESASGDSCSGSGYVEVLSGLVSHVDVLQQLAR